MATWTFVEGQLSDGKRMRFYMAAEDGRLCRSGFADDLHPLDGEAFLRGLAAGSNGCDSEGHDLLRIASDQVREYFDGRRLGFELPYELRGTAFQVRVWEQLLRIPFGVRRTYRDIAEAVGQPTACRAVGNANGRNNLPLFIPCHRVVATGGGLCGFAGGIGLKKRLLAHEEAVLGTRTDLWFRAAGA